MVGHRKQIPCLHRPDLVTKLRKPADVASQRSRITSHIGNPSRSPNRQSLKHRGTRASPRRIQNHKVQTLRQTTHQSGDIPHGESGLGNIPASQLNRFAVTFNAHHLTPCIDKGPGEQAHTAVEIRSSLTPAGLQPSDHRLRQNFRCALMSLPKPVESHLKHSIAQALFHHRVSVFSGPKDRPISRFGSQDFASRPRTTRPMCDARRRNQTALRWQGHNVAGSVGPQTTLTLVVSHITHPHSPPKRCGIHVLNVAWKLVSTQMGELLSNDATLQLAGMGGIQMEEITTSAAIADRARRDHPMRARLPNGSHLGTRKTFRHFGDPDVDHFPAIGAADEDHLPLVTSDKVPAMCNRTNLHPADLLTDL